MKTVRRFLVAELVWASAIFLLIMPITIASSDPLTAEQYIRWLGRALVLAAFPAGIAVGKEARSDPRPWRPVLGGLVAASAVALLLLAVIAVLLPVVGDSLSLPLLADRMSADSQSWETRNDAAWDLYGTLFVPVHTLLMAAIGMQVGVWASYALPAVLHRLLYWLVGLGLMLSGYSVSDTTYEVVVLHTAADVGFSAFYTLLLPAGICAGLALPTLAYLRGAEINRSST